MERFEFNYPVAKPLAGRAEAGLVGSGDLEALYEPKTVNELKTAAIPYGRTFLTV